MDSDHGSLWRFVPVSQPRIMAVVRAHQPDGPLGQIVLDVSDAKERLAEQSGRFSQIIAGNREHRVGYVVVEEGQGLDGRQPRPRLAADAADAKGGRRRLHRQLVCGGGRGCQQAHGRTTIRDEPHVGAVDPGLHQWHQAAHGHRDLHQTHDLAGGRGFLRSGGDQCGQGRQHTRPSQGGQLHGRAGSLPVPGGGAAAFSAAAAEEVRLNTGPPL